KELANQFKKEQLLQHSKLILNNIVTNQQYIRIDLKQTQLEPFVNLLKQISNQEEKASIDYELCSSKVNNRDDEEECPPIDRCVRTKDSLNEVIQYFEQILSIDTLQTILKEYQDKHIDYICRIQDNREHNK